MEKKAKNIVRNKDKAMNVYKELQALRAENKKLEEEKTLLLNKEYKLLQDKAQLVHELSGLQNTYRIYKEMTEDELRHPLHRIARRLIIFFS